MPTSIHRSLRTTDSFLVKLVQPLLLSQFWHCISFSEKLPKQSGISDDSESNITYSSLRKYVYTYTQINESAIKILYYDSV